MLLSESEKINKRRNLLQQVLLLSFMFIIPFPTGGQPYYAGHTSLSLIDQQRDNRNVPAEVWYPAEKAGDNVPVAGPAGTDFPVLCFAHGYMMPWDSYTYLCDALVSKGFILVFPSSGEELFPSHADLARDISFLLEKMTEYGHDENTIFCGKISRMNCAMGHSMGGWFCCFGSIG